MKLNTVDSVLLAALEQFKYQATNRLLLVVLEEYEDSGTTQKVKKTAAMYMNHRLFAVSSTYLVPLFSTFVYLLHCV